jgi:4-amino-4-deoxy-L-arabinose transferase-like glycosyltransferase
MSARPVNTLTSSAWSRTHLAWLALFVMAVLVYVLGLNGQYIPTNGDELVYTHIARLTAASGHWLPLVSELDHMRNTKPPLLFWQAMVAGNWGQHWSMAALRTPSVIYTLLTALAVGWTVQLITRDARRAFLAACIYLAFLCTFRYGRTYLTSAPETFWLNIPMFCLLWWQLALAKEPLTSTQTGVAVTQRQKTLGWPAHLGFGLAMGIGLAYKSFALIAPAAATLWCAQMVNCSPWRWRASLSVTMKVSLSALISLGIFGLWFVFDPDPLAVWQEFVLGENAGKLSNSAGYWHTALFGGGFSIWAQLFGYAQNAGLLAFVVIGLMTLGLQNLWKLRPRPLRANPNHLSIILVWLAVWLLVFTLPSQRSARYLIPAMPALAMLLALFWERVGRGWFVPSLILCGLGIGFLGRISWAAYELGIGDASDLILALVAVCLGFGLVLAGLVNAAWTRSCTLAASLTVFGVFGLTTAPLNGPSGLYGDQITQTLKAKRIAVPSSFNGQFERFEFLLPGNRFSAYDGDARLFRSKGENIEKMHQLLQTHDAVVWLQTRDETSQPLCAPSCIVLDERWEVRGRHQSGEITFTNLWLPQQWLFRREWLVTPVANAASAGSSPARP